MNDYELELGTNLVCVTCGDSLESWEVNEMNVCFICECLSDQALTPHRGVLQFYSGTNKG